MPSKHALPLLLALGLIAPACASAPPEEPGDASLDAARPDAQGPPPRDAARDLDASTVPDASSMPDARADLDAGPPVEGPWEQPLSPSSLPSTQLNVSADTWRGWQFANLLRGTQAWLLDTSGAPLDEAAADARAAGVTLDAHGWPTALPDHTEIQIHTGYTAGEAVDP